MDINIFAINSDGTRIRRFVGSEKALDVYRDSKNMHTMNFINFCL